MFFELISRNSKRSRKENGLFFATLLVSIVAFYIILSLSGQDVMVFLAKMESDAVNRILTIVPVFYGVTLVILFFLIYFASRFQMERRRHEFGVYLMMGMRRSKLFLLLLAEDFQSSVLALAMGLPAAVLLSELISLVTARLVGLGILGHRFSISLPAILWTTVGFTLIKFAAFLLLSGKISREEIGSLLVDTPEGVKKPHPAALYALALLAGGVLLAVAYMYAISGRAWKGVAEMGLTLLCGLAGTLSLFYGLRSVMGFFAWRGGGERLRTFTFRQLEETVIRRSTTLAVSSLLILAALCCFGAGVAIAKVQGGSGEHVLDYTFPIEGEMQMQEENVAATLECLDSYGITPLFSELFEMRVGYIRIAEDYNDAFQMDAVLEGLAQQPESSDRDVLIGNLGYATYPYLISQSCYNRLLTAAGLPEIILAEGEAAVYMNREMALPARSQILNQVLEGRPEVQIAGQPYCLVGEVQTADIVTDRSITLSFSLIVPDEVFDYLVDGDYSTYLNGVLDPGQIEGKSLLTAISEVNGRLDETGLSYESYLQNMGRQLFYVVSASYITIYLAIIFLIVANTAIGIQFLTGQKKTGRRYQILIRLGASYDTLCASAGKQIRWYFGIPAAIAVISSMAGIRSLLGGILFPGAQGSLPMMMVISVAMILLLCVVEWIYMAAVRRASNRYILTLMVPEREE